VYDADPNGHSSTVSWPRYTAGDGDSMLLLSAGNLSVIMDDYRADRIGYFNTILDALSL
jgi:hypothetical protein